ncbi:hypothetical protein CANCADRAFT_124301 [Tortispora caseinolytica NRRL Y-17796]|uniref:AMP-dependent synthetase/ligase domain-containing protein n=1 Tax=Tortispora caseinolytica NRRL Y-17796 TaxID=767744 RepID=A0A1E4T9T3_9ASCO|nr:hypothetical protein CANCADRAFT_124301 [Tortispora caseinolytica NRRL Y-17796]
MAPHKKYSRNIVYDKPPFSVIVSEPKEGETGIFRSPSSKDALMTSPDPSITTVYNILEYGARKYPSRPCLGSRVLKTVIKESKKVPKMIDGERVMVDKEWEYFELSPYKYITYTEAHNIVKATGSGLRELGIQPNGKERLHMFAATSQYWLTTALGAMSQNIPIVTAYDTLGEDGLIHSIKDTETRAIFTDATLLKSLVNPVKECHLIRYIFYRNDHPADAPANIDNEIIATLKGIRGDIQIMPINDLIKLGQLHPHDTIQADPSDLACIMYTSGSTGKPKGVVLKNSNVVAGVAGADGTVNRFRYFLSPEDRIITYLPLAHILEFVVELSGLVWGTSLGYGTVRTLSDLNVRNCLGDIRECQPTVMVGVGAVWETIRKGIINNLEKQSALVRKLFWSGYKLKQIMSNYGIPGQGVIDSVIFKKVKVATGGKLRVLFAGGSAVSTHTQEFLSLTVAPMIIGYGLTETCAMCCIMPPSELCLGTVGGPVTCIEMKLIDIPEADYYTKSNPPQGEIVVRGPPVTSEYFKNEEETNAVFKDGWFYTGDVGELTPTGHVKIIDRRKNLIKTLNGEYVALEKLESIYRSNPYVANVCVYADSTRLKPIAIVLPNEPKLVELAKSLGIEGDHLQSLVHDELLVKKVSSSLIETGKQGGLKGIELINTAVLTDKEWTPQNGFVTPAQKLQRRAILEDNRAAVTEAYNRTEGNA